jgi:plastocyanin
MKSTGVLLRRSGLMVAGVCLAAVLAGCGGGGDGAGSSGSNSTTEALPTSITIVMKDNFFEPRTVTIPVGKEVEIQLDNQGVNIHNLVADSFTSPILEGGAKGEMKVKFDKVGDVKFICAFHQPDMTGTFTVK